MSIPFSREQFLDVFQKYNEAVWPMQVVLSIVALIALYLSIRKHQRSDVFISVILALLWTWMGGVYHLAFFTGINKAAYVFGLFYIVQAFLFLYIGVVKGSLSFRYRSDTSGLAGAALLLYAMLIYPVLGYLFGHSYPASPTFGLPCPTTIFTFGILLWTDKKVPLLVLVIPFLWSIIGFTAALSLGIREDFGLFVAGLLGVILLVMRGQKGVEVIA